MSGLDAACPQCGAPVHFGAGTSLAAVCSYCRSAVARKGVELELIGKVPDLVTTQSRLALGDAGALGDRPFTIVGRLQLDQGAAAWDEWYLAFADGTDGWLAEAQGKLLVTRRVEAARLPAFSSLEPGAHVQMKGHPQLTVDELGTARFTSASGELPFRPARGATYRFADLSGRNREFGTLDYGDSDGEPELFAGRQLSYSEAKLDRAIAGRTVPAIAGEEGKALACPSCGAPVSLKRAESASMVCGSCRSLLDINAGTLALIGKLAQRSEPLIPLGARGTLRGAPVEVLGYLRRYTQDDGRKYYWSEWQLHGPNGYSWLSEYDGHFTWQEPIAGGEVRGDYKHDGPVRCEDARYRHFQTAVAHYADIQGELSWQVRADQTVKIRDYVAPPRLLSCEEERNEVNWSRGEYLDGGEVWAALKLPGKPPAPQGVAPSQPNPFHRGAEIAGWCAVLGTVALIVLAVFIHAAMPNEVMVSLQVPLTQDSVVVSEPFELRNARQAVSISASTVMKDAWAGMDLALIDDGTGEVRTLAFELSHFEGTDDGERWSEGSDTAAATLGSVPAGRYVLRAEVSLDPATAHRVPPYALVSVVRGVFTWAPFVLALLALWPPAVYVRARSSSFERRRWADSDEGEDDQ